MSWFHKIVLLFLFVCSGGLCEQAYRIDLRSHLDQLKEMCFPKKEFDLNRQRRRDYIKTTFEYYRLTTQFQNFTTQIYLNNSIVGVTGWNIIAQSESLDKSAPVLLIGTYYDNTNLWNPLVETGAAVASLLETSRVFQDRFAEESYPTLSVLFVAFDLNVKNYQPYAKGSPGSSFFVQNWLRQNLRTRKLLGAVILDSIGSFNESENAVKIPEYIKKDYYEAYEKIENSNLKGNFLSIFSSLDRKMADTFKDKFEKAEDDGQSFQVIDMLIQNNTRTDGRMWTEHIWNTPMYDFWNLESVPTLRLSDMVKDRTDLLALRRYDYLVEDFWAGRRKSFVETTTRALIETLFELYRRSEETENVPPQNATTGTDTVVTTNASPKPSDDTGRSSSTTQINWWLLALCAVLFL